MEQLPGGESLVRDLVLRIAALEDNMAFLELWCEEQQDALDRIGEPVFFDDVVEEDEEEDEPGRVRLRVVDLRDQPDPPDEETEYDRKVRQLRARIHRMRNGLPAQGAAK
jgi:hypothetical protein